MIKKGKLILLTTILFSILTCSTPEQEATTEKEEIYLCNAEEINAEKWRFTEANQKNFYFENIDRQSDDVAFSGKYSVKLYPGAPYGMTTELKNVKPDEYIEITAWRKSKNQNGVIALDGGPGFYYAGKHVIEKDENGWERIFLECHIPPNFNSEKFKIYVWNYSQDTVYFDDFKIVIRDLKKYPDFSDVNGLDMYVDQVYLDTLAQKRIKAFETTVLVNSDEDYADAILFDGIDFLNAGFRLKGDLVDHLQGEKWSFRLKLKNTFTWQNMRIFSIQNPSTRYFLSEWLAHKIFEQEDVLTTRYGFVPVSVNKKSLGIYAWEEHFEKQLVESSNRREGPIIRFDESIFWQAVLEAKVSNRLWDIDFFGASKITPFKEGRTMTDSLLSKQFNQAQKLLLQYKHREKPISEIFDVDNLARYYALIDITQFFHGFTWHNQRFYYNPVTCLLEPVAFDGYIETGIYKRIDEQVTGLLKPEKLASYDQHELMMFQVFSDSAFNKKYIDYLQKFSSPFFIDGVISGYKSEADSLSELIKREFPYYEFSFDQLISQAEFIRNSIDLIKTNCKKLGAVVQSVNNEKFKKEYTTDLNKNLMPLLVNAYYNRTKEQLEIINYTNHHVKILAVSKVQRLPESFNKPPVLEPYKGISAPEVSIPVNGEPVKILFSVNYEEYEAEVSPWPAPKGITARQQIFSQADFSKLPVTGNQVIFEGDFQFVRDVVIPDSFEVVITAGTTIDLINGAGFFSFSPVKMEGTIAEPVYIISSDQSANGFNVLQPDGRSELQFVQFDGLSNLRKGGWVTPSAVTFYEADVNFENCTFTNNSNCDDALNVVRSEFTAVNCTFENTFADAFDSDFSTGKVQGCVFRNTGNDAIDFSGSQVKITNCKMIDIADKAISGGENSQLTVSNCEIKNANIGVAAKDLSKLELDKIIMENTVYGLVAFIKKPEYGLANITIDNLKMKTNLIFHQIETGSSLVLNGKTIHGKEKNLAIKLYQ